MKKIVKILIINIFILSLFFFLVACQGEKGPWDSLGGDKEGEIAEEIDTEKNETDVDKIIDEVDKGLTKEEAIPDTSENINQAVTISKSGDYHITGSFTGEITVKASDVHLFLDNCQIVASDKNKKVISSKYSLVITLIGESSLSNLEGSSDKTGNAISVDEDLTLNGTGKLTISSTKSGIKCSGSFYGLGGDLIIYAGTHHGVDADNITLYGINISVLSGGKDGIHAESDDTVREFAFERGFVYINGETELNVSGVYGDGIQADTFVSIKSGTINISTIPTWIPATSTDGCYRLINGIYNKMAKDEVKNQAGYWQLESSCKGIKVGEIDYEIEDENGVNEYIVVSNNYIIIIDGGNFNINTTDDAIHTNSGDLIIRGGTFVLSTSDDAICADKNVKISGGALNIVKSYEGIEGQNIHISGGLIQLVATDDGINASDSETTSTQQRQNCQIIISGGRIYVNSMGDGVDSNGSFLVTGGELYIYGPTSGADGALDSEAGIVVNGGTIIALGSSGMVETPATNSSQLSVAINLNSSLSGNVIVKDSNNNIICEFDPISIFGTTKEYQSIVISSSKFYLNQTYTILTRTTTTTVKLTSTITKVGKAQGPGARP